MIYKRSFFAISCLVLAGFSGVAGAQYLRDGRVFDPGFAMSERAEDAPEQLDEMAFYYGHWDVTYRTFRDDSLLHEARGLARVNYMNRGHAIMERFHCIDFDGAGNELSTISFLAYNTANSVWSLGVANSFTESIVAYSGTFADGDLLLTGSARRAGGVQLYLFEFSFTCIGEDAFDVELRESTDFGKTWSRIVVKEYRRRAASDGFLTWTTEYGAAAPRLPREARQFDFLIGEWDAHQTITVANGQSVQFPSIATAVYTLNGHAVMECGWYDVDPSLPDAATSIVRIYNRVTRRWECMYTTNRFNSVLFFGGVREGKNIVLHLFDTDLTNPTIQYYVFHNIRQDGYDWYAQSSTDRGANFDTTWVINVTRRE